MSSTQRPKILFVTSVYPHGPEYGSQQRVLNLLRILARAGDVSLVLACPLPIDQDSIRETQKEFRVAHTAVVTALSCLSWTDRLRFELDPTWVQGHLTGVSERDRAIIKEIVNQHDVTWVYTLRAANECLIWRWPRTIMDIDAIPSQVAASSGRSGANAVRNLLDRRMSVIWRRRERFVPERFDMVAVCSESDRAYLGYNGSEVRVIPNGFAASGEGPARQLAVPPRIGFVGWFGGLPNRAGMDWFIKEAWPLVKGTVPEARLRLVGGDVDPGLFGAAPDTDLLGYMKDPANEMSTWSAMIVPIRVGGGTRIKIAHAFSEKCPVVSTALGAFGYEVASGNELLIADTPEDFAAACVHLMREPNLGRELAERAWNRYAKSWTWDAIAPAVLGAINAVLSNGSGKSETGPEMCSAENRVTNVV